MFGFDDPLSYIYIRYAGSGGEKGPNQIVGGRVLAEWAPPLILRVSVN